MSKISIKTDFDDGNKLFSADLNNNFRVIQAGINANEENLQQVINEAIIRLDAELLAITANRGWDWNDGKRVTFFRGSSTDVVQQPIIDGQFVIATNGRSYIDYGNSRIPFGETLDTEMSDISERGVQNKVIKEYVDESCQNVHDYVDEKTGDIYKMTQKSENISMLIKLQGKNSSNLYYDYKSFNVDVPISFIKAGAMTSVYFECQISLSQSATNASIVNNKLNISISSSDMTTLSNGYRIWLNATQSSQLDNYSPLFIGGLGTTPGTSFQKDGLTFYIGRNNNSNYLEARTDNLNEIGGGAFFASLTYMSNNLNYPTEDPISSSQDNL